MKSIRFSAVSVAIITVLSTGAYAASQLPDSTNTASQYSGSDVFLLIVYVSVALGFSFLCSIAESVLLSITPSYIEGLKEKKSKLAPLIKQLKQDNVDRSLAAILTVNTIAHTVGAIGAGAKASLVFGSSWFGLFSAVLTLMILFLSEIVPKTIGAVFWTKLVGPTALFIKTLIITMYPMVRISEILTQFISRNQKPPLFTRDEFIAMASVGMETGEIKGKESRIIRNLFRFESLTVNDIMTPRTVMYALPQDMTINDAVSKITVSQFSRIPVYENLIDDITGFILKDDILIFSAQGKLDDTLKSLRRDILAVPDSISLTVLFEKLLKDRHNIAIVVNEHGSTEGLVTLEDLIETLTGMEIVDETDDVVDMRKFARKQWNERAKAMGIETETTYKTNDFR
ncbi:MAG: CNNM domain-containing protein [Thermodesulfobacteriota bacterium]